MIYLDNAATTKVFEVSAQAASYAMLENYFNPNATYGSAVKANECIERSRSDIARAAGTKSNELIFTSGATESNNWVFNYGRKNKKGNIVITAGEHASVYETAMRFKSSGTDVRIAPLTSQGNVDLQALISLVDDNTSLVSAIHVSNETGVINPIKAISEAVRRKNPKTLIHCDGVQGFLKLGEPLSDLDVDYYSASAHKLGAPKGIGLLYVRDGLNIAPMLCGGGQEHGLRSGTQNTPYIAAFAAAVKQFVDTADRTATANIRNELCKFFISNECEIIGDGENSGYVLCVFIPDVKAEILQNIVHDDGVIVGKGAACSGTKRGNRVLSAMKIPDTKIECCIRISLFSDTTSEDAIRAANIIVDAAKKIRSAHVK